MDTISNNHEADRRKSVWRRGLVMIVFLLLLNLAVTVLAVLTIVQFFWVVFKDEKNQGLTEFGQSLGLWFRAVIAFLTMETDIKPFPWATWPNEDDR